MTSTFIHRIMTNLEFAESNHFVVKNDVTSNFQMCDHVTEKKPDKNGENKRAFPLPINLVFNPTFIL